MGLLELIELEVGGGPRGPGRTGHGPGGRELVIESEDDVAKIDCQQAGEVAVGWSISEHALELVELLVAAGYGMRTGELETRCRAKERFRRNRSGTGIRKVVPHEG